MATWQDWTKIADGPFQDMLTLWRRRDAPFIFCYVLDAAGNIIKMEEDQAGNDPSGWKSPQDLGGSGVIAHPPIEGGSPLFQGYVVRGHNEALYLNNQQTSGWEKTGGVGLFASDAVENTSSDSDVAFYGQGKNNKLWRGYGDLVANDHDSGWAWEDLGQPGSGVKGRPNIIWADGAMNIFVRGQDDHLWHRQEKQDQGQHVWTNWVNLGGGLTSLPANAVRGDFQTIESFVIGEENALWLRTGDGVNWGAWENLGGDFQGNPAAAYMSSLSDRTFVFVRGTDDGLWYRERIGNSWQAWQRDDLGILSSDPVAVMHPTSDSGARVVAFVLGVNGALWERTLKLSQQEL
jgi:hypothetical protein